MEAIKTIKKEQRELLRYRSSIASLPRAPGGGEKGEQENIFDKTSIRRGPGAKRGLKERSSEGRECAREKG